MPTTSCILEISRYSDTWFWFNDSNYFYLFAGFICVISFWTCCTYRVLPTSILNAQFVHAPRTTWYITPHIAARFVTKILFGYKLQLGTRRSQLVGMLLVQPLVDHQENHIPKVGIDVYMFASSPNSHVAFNTKLIKSWRRDNVESSAARRRSEHVSHQVVFIHDLNI